MAKQVATRLQVAPVRQTPVNAVQIEEIAKLLASPNYLMSDQTVSAIGCAHGSTVGLWSLAWPPLSKGGVSGLNGLKVDNLHFHLTVQAFTPLEKRSVGPGLSLEDLVMRAVPVGGGQAVTSEVSGGQLAFTNLERNKKYTLELVTQAAPAPTTTN